MAQIINNGKNLLIILIGEDYKHVLASWMPNESIEDVIQDEWDAFTKLKKVKDIAKCYILAYIYSTTNIRLRK